MGKVSESAHAHKTNMCEKAIISYSLDSWISQKTKQRKATIYWASTMFLYFKSIISAHLYNPPMGVGAALIILILLKM